MSIHVRPVRRSTESWCMDGIPARYRLATGEETIEYPGNGSFAPCTGLVGCRTLLEGDGIRKARTRGRRRAVPTE